MKKPKIIYLNFNGSVEDEITFDEDYYIVFDEDNEKKEVKL